MEKMWYKGQMMRRKKKKHRTNWNEFSHKSFSQKLEKIRFEIR